MSRLFVQTLMVLVLFLLSHASNAQTADPTRPLGAVASTSGQMGAGEAGVSLTTILIASDRKLAIVNGQTVHENQTLKNSGIVVKKIEADAVTLQQGSKVWRLPLNKVAIRK